MARISMHGLAVGGLSSLKQHGGLRAAGCTPHYGPLNLLRPQRPQAGTPACRSCEHSIKTYPQQSGAGSQHLPPPAAGTLSSPPKCLVSFPRLQLSGGHNRGAERHPSLGLPTLPRPRTPPQTHSTWRGGCWGSRSQRKLARLLEHAHWTRAHVGTRPRPPGTPKVPSSIPSPG